MSSHDVTEPRLANLLRPNVPLIKQQLGLGLYSVTNCTGDILWRFTKITPRGNRLHYSNYKQYTYAIIKKQKWSLLHWVTLPLPQSSGYHGTILIKTNAWRQICNFPISPRRFKMFWHQIGVRPPVTTILTIQYITATSNDRHGVSKYRLIECLFNRVFFRLTTKTSKVRVTVPLWGESTLTCGFPAQRDSNVENLFDDVIMD